ncbi:MAG: helical backbone metal receptor [Bacteroidetes bacterium]|nr:helical backbone metal receptor [Bacteroidota bacterium]
MKRYLILAVILLGLSSCRTKSGNETGLQINDDLGKSFVFASPPSNVISLAPSITEIVYFLGAENKLAGVTKYCDYPPEAKLKKNVGGILDPNLELIAGLKPDLIFLTTEGNSKMTYKSLIDLGCNVFVLNPKKIGDIVSAMEKINSILKPEKGNEKIGDFRLQVDNLIAHKDSAYSYAAFLSVKPLISFSDNTFIGDIFLNSGFKNIFGGEKLDYPGIYDEDLILKNPDFMLFLSDSSQTSVSNINSEIKERFSEMNSYKNRRCVILNENIFSRPGPRVLDALKSLKSLRENI